MRPECARAAAAFRLPRNARPTAGTQGARVGDTPGAGLEFFDQREYQPGDDLRRIDWRSVARTDRYMVRRYAQETSPWIDVVIDCSASMASTPTKAQAVTDLVQAFELWGDADGGGRGTVRCLSADGTRIASKALGFDSPQRQLGPFAGLRAKSRRVLISDFLFPSDPAPAIRQLAVDASQLDIVQLLDPSELDPTRLAQLPAEADDELDWSADDRPEIKLIDRESGGALTVRLDEATLAGYQKRLRALQSSVLEAARATRARCACLTADTPSAMFANLLAAGMVEPDG